MGDLGLVFFKLVKFEIENMMVFCQCMFVVDVKCVVIVVVKVSRFY